MQTIKSMIDSADTIAVLSHTNPDGDTVGCALAMVLVLQKMGKKVVSICDCALPRDLSALPHADIFAKGDRLGEYDLAIAVDCATLGMLGESAAVLPKCRHSLCIDHHLIHDDYCEYDFVRIAAANAENIFDILFAQYPTLVDVEVAECLYTAIITDSGGFCYSSVTPHTHEAAARLLAYGLDNERICYEQLRKQELRVLKMRTEAYAKAVYEFDNRVAIVVFSLELQAKYQADLEDMTGALVDMMRATEVQIALSMVEVKPRQYKISARSKGNYSAADICQTFGGGGHRNAAGCRLNGEEGIVMDNLLEACRKVL